VRHSGIAKKTIADFERGATTPRSRTMEEIERALIDAGIEFLNDGTPGVRFAAELSNSLKVP